MTVRPKQSKKLSLLEAMVSTFIGFVLSYLMGLIIFPLIGFDIGYVQNFNVVLAYTLLSLIRGYFIRRLFNVF